MKAVITKEANAPFEVVNDIEKPKPGPGQILVKSIATAINPVDTIMTSGLLVSSFPIVLGCDASGIVVEVGSSSLSEKEEEEVVSSSSSSSSPSFKVGDRVCGCTRLGEPGYGTFQEYFLMDAKLTTPISPKIELSYEEAATIGVGTETASLGLFNGLRIPLPDPKALPEPKDEWILILGGAGSVGQYAIQLAKLCGYKVVATSSEKSSALIKSLGADDYINYSKTEEEQLKDLKNITGGKFVRIFDTVGKSGNLSLRAFKEVSTPDKPDKYFTTTVAWTSKEGPPKNVSIYNILLALKGKPKSALVAAKMPNLNDDLAAYIQLIGQLLEDGNKVVPNKVELVTKGGFEGVEDAVDFQRKKGTFASTGKKIVIKLQEE